MPTDRAHGLLPGFALLGLFALGATVVAPVVPGFNALLIAVGMGAVISNTMGVPSWAESGIGRHKLILEVGIVLLGARLTLAQLVDAGPTIIALATVVVFCGIVLIEAFSHVADLGKRTGSLLAAGSSVCGVSAVVAVAGGIDADESDIAYAVATVLLFDAVTLVAFPLVGETLQLSSQVFGVWAGLSMFSTGPVTAAGFAHSTTAGEWATVTKLVRNSLIGVVVVGYSLYYTRSSTSKVSIATVWRQFPKFIIGFVAVAVLVNLAGAPADTIGMLDSLSEWLFTLAFVGLGFEMQLDEFRNAGLTPVLVVLAYLVVMSIVSLVAVSALLS
ncbi:YeiH family protein [Haloferax sp. DFSO52]|uniref:YeiH family protein n=1 Tax=Haloferax sp. DFSO52 TaxID=3388505 RepID=UPI003A8515B2